MSVRRGVMELTLDELAEVLGLPKGTKVLGAQEKWEGQSTVRFLLEGAGMPEVQPGKCYPQVTPVYGGDGCGGTIVTGWHA